MKFMNTKRFGAVVMSGALALSLTVPAFAGSSPPPVGEVTITGAYKDIPISVVVPTTGTAQLNPYGLPVNVAISEEAVTPITGQKITTQPLSIKNIGTVKLDVKGTLLVKPTGDVSIGTAKGANEAATAKTIAVNLDVVGLNDDKYKVSADDEGLVFALNAAFAADATWTNKQSLAAPAYAKGATAPPAVKSTNAMATLGAATVADDVVTFGKDSIALFRLSGDLNEEPKTDSTTDAPWTTTDGFEAKIAFKFTPHQDAATTYAITIGSVTGGTVTADVATAAAGATVTLTPTPTTPGETPTYTVYKTGDNTTTVSVTGDTFTMPAYPVTVDATFA